MDMIRGPRCVQLDHNLCKVSSMVKLLAYKSYGQWLQLQLEFPFHEEREDSIALYRSCVESRDKVTLSGRKHTCTAQLAKLIKSVHFGWWVYVKQTESRIQLSMERSL